MLLPKRIWKNIEGYEGLYQVSNLGEVKSLKFAGGSKSRKLKLGKTSNGYMKIVLGSGKNRKTFSIHRLVAMAFIPNPNNYPEVNHKDEDKTNNIVTNLEWCTRGYNANYGTISERLSSKVSYSRRNKSNCSKKIICVTTGEIFNCILDASEKYKIPSGNISANAKGRIKTAGKHPITREKLVWEYVDKLNYKVGD